MKQKTLFNLSKYSSDFGGSLLIGKRRSSRPISTKNSLHIVLRGDTKLSGSLLKYRSDIDSGFKRFSEKFGVKIYKHSIVSNHVHFVGLFNSRQQYVKFIRALTGFIAIRTKIIWTLRPYSRILAWGRSFRTAIDYVIKNHLEALGVIAYQERAKRKRR